MDKETGQSQDPKQTENSEATQHSQENTPNLDSIFRKGYNEGKTKAYNKAYSEIQEKLGIEINDDNINTIKTLMENQKNLETEKLMKKEEFEKIIQSKEKTHNEQIGILKNQNTEYENSLRRLVIGNEILALASKHSAYDSYDIEANLSRLYNFDYDKKTLEKKVLNKDGTLAINKRTGEPLTLEDAILELKSNPDKKHLFKAREIQGSGVNNGNGNNASFANVTDLRASLAKQIEAQFR